MKKLTKEEFLQMKNIEVLKEVKGALDYKEEMAKVNSYLYGQKKYRLPFCLQGSEARKRLRFNYYAHAMLVDLLEMVHNEELVPNLDKTLDWHMKEVKLRWYKFLNVILRNVEKTD